MKIIEMKQKRANINVQIRNIIDAHEKVEMDQLKTDELKNLETEFDNLSQKIINAEKQLERDRITGEKEEAKNEKPTNKIEEAFSNYIKNPTNANLEIYNALQQNNPAQAGYLVAPEKMMAGIIEAKNNTMIMRNLCNVLPPLTKSQSLGVIKRTNRLSTFAWGTELQAPTPDSSLSFGKRQFIPKVATGGILVSRTLIRNSTINAESYVQKEMAYDQSENEEEAFMLGDGTNKPLGIFVASVDGISTSRDVSTGNTTTEVKIDGLKEAKYSLHEAYRKTASWLFHTDCIKKLSKLKDNDGQYIWQPSIQVGEADMLLGLKLTESVYVPNTFTTGQYVGMLGDFKAGYWIVDSLNYEIQALMELYANTNQVYYIGRYEVDGAPAVEEAFVRIKLA